MTSKALNVFKTLSEFKTKIRAQCVFGPSIVTHIKSGLLMVIDIFEERGGSAIDIRWGNPELCNFSLFPILKPLPYTLMCLLYAVMWIGAFGMMLGVQFKVSTICFTVPYWYILLLDKSFWNNHSYLYGIIGILLVGCSAENVFSIESIFNKNIRNKPIPYWNYFILKYQFFMMYFLAGLKKADAEWLQGYSMTRLGEHWVFWPFSVILSTEQIDYLVVHLFGFIMDLTIGFWMLYEVSRPVAMICCALFNLMNSRLFSIGMFPYVCLATLPLFCKEDWPKVLWRNVLYLLGRRNYKRKRPNISIEAKDIRLDKLNQKVSFKKKLVVILLLGHMGLQAFLPFSHFITKGYNNWTNGLYGYSWDMMVHSWETVLVVVKVVDNDSGQEHFIDPQVWAHNERWTKHADMCLQYAKCVKRNLENNLKDKEKHISLSENISIYIDVWCSLNKRFQQRMYDPHQDLLTAKWSPFRPVEWLLPVIAEYNDFRRKMDEITRDVQSWNNESDVMFVADFPGMHLENYIGEDFSNITLTVLEGEVIFEIEDDITMQSLGVKLQPGDSVAVPEGYQHKVHTVSKTPSCYMYTFAKSESSERPEEVNVKTYSPFPIFEDFPARKEGFLTMIGLIRNVTMHLLYGTALEIRNKSVTK